LASTPIIVYIVRATKKVDVRIFGVSMKPQLAPAVGTIKHMYLPY